MLRNRLLGSQRDQFSTLSGREALVAITIKACLLVEHRRPEASHGARIASIDNDLVEANAHQAMLSGGLPGEAPTGLNSPTERVRGGSGLDSLRLATARGYRLESAAHAVARRHVHVDGDADMFELAGKDLSSVRCDEWAIVIGRYAERAETCHRVLASSVEDEFRALHEIGSYQRQINLDDRGMFPSTARALML